MPMLLPSPWCAVRSSPESSSLLLTSSVAVSWHGVEQILTPRIRIRALMFTSSAAIVCWRGCLQAFMAEDIPEIGACVDRYWAQKKIMAAGCEPALVRDMMAVLRPHVYGQVSCCARARLLKRLDSVVFFACEYRHSHESKRQVHGQLPGSCFLTRYTWRRTANCL